MTDVVAIAMAGSPDFVATLQAVWNDGNAAAPIDPTLPRDARRDALAAIAPSVVIDEVGDRHTVPGGRPAGDDDALVVLTSGSTGRPKGVVLTHDAVAASATATSARLSVQNDTDRWLACLPVHHIGGLSVITRAVHTATPLVVLPGFDATQVSDEAGRGATLVSLVPTALQRIDAGAFRSVLLGGAAPSTPPAPNVVTTYGMTETGSGVIYDGLPLNGIEIRLGDEGEILVRGPMLLRCYRDGTDPTDEDGWLATGDRGRWAEDRLLVEGRADDLIITGGENVWPQPVEAAIQARADIASAAVVGLPDAEWGQRVAAHVVVAAGHEAPSLTDIRATVQAVLPRWHAPKELVIASTLPRTPSGKLRRAALRA